MDGFEQTIQMYHSIYVGCGIGALLMLAVSAFLFFYFRIPKVYGLLTGKTAEKEIRMMKEERAGQNNVRPDKKSHAKKVDMGNLVSPSGRLGTSSDDKYSKTEALASDTGIQNREVIEKTEASQQNFLLEDKRPVCGTFRIEKEIMLIHTDEII